MQVPYTFVSHASEDKVQRVRPLVEALLLQGARLWLDRPGLGENHFGFDQDFIEKHHIRSLQSGLSWREQIDAALRESGAVLVCISRALCAQRQVLVHELLLGAHHRKLVACIVDDIPYSDIPRDLGLADASGIQADRIDSSILSLAVQHVEAAGLANASRVLEPELERQWELVRKLFSDIKEIYLRYGLRETSPVELDEAVQVLNHVPIGPMVHFHEIPSEIIALFSDRFGDPENTKSFVHTAMQVRSRCNPEGFTDRQILVGPGEILNPRSVAAEEFWSDLFASAGRKSRRTLAALLLAPGAPREDTVRQDEAFVLAEFKKRLALGKR